MAKYISFLFLLLTLAGYAQKIGNRGKITAFTGATIYPSPEEPVIRNGTILVRNGKIISVGESSRIRIPAGTETIDCSGKFITAGFWNSHVHLTEPQFQHAASIPADSLMQRLQRMLSSYGVTYAFDIASVTENTLIIRKRISSGEVPGPTVFTTGIPFAPPDGNPFYVEPLKLPVLSDTAQARKDILQHLQQGVDGVKLFVGSPAAPGKVVLMQPDVAREAVAVAHQHGKPVFAHPSSTAGISVIIQSGIDIAAHSTPDDGKPWSEELAGEMVASNVYLIPTLKLWKWVLQQNKASGDAVREFVGLGIQQVNVFKSNGGKILFGTDVGFMSDYDPSDEYRFMQQAGLNFKDILASLTTTPAEKFGHQDRTGRIQVGMDADMVILTGSPEIDITNLAKVKATYKKGVRIF